MDNSQIPNQTPFLQNPEPQTNISTPDAYSQPQREPQKKEPLGTAALVLGIVSLVLFWWNILILPLSITGLILSIVNKAKGGKKKSGIILNIISTVIAIIMFSAIIIGIIAGSDNYIAGKYDCTGVDSSTDGYLVTLHLNDDNTFFYAPYGRSDKNYAKGTYMFEDEHKTNNSGDYKYYMVSLTGPKEQFIIDGVESDNDFQTQMEIGLTENDGKKEGVIMFTNTYNMYYCYEQ